MGFFGVFLLVCVAAATTLAFEKPTRRGPDGELLADEIPDFREYIKPVDIGFDEEGARERIQQYITDLHDEPVGEPSHPLYRRPITAQEEEHLEKMFKAFDFNRDGWLEELELSGYVKAVLHDRYDADEIFDFFHKRQNMRVSVDEFKRMMAKRSKRRSHPDHHDLHTYETALMHFHFHDDDKSGHLSHDELERLHTFHGWQGTPQDAHDHSDHNKDGRLDPHEFADYHLMRHSEAKKKWAASGSGDSGTSDGAGEEKTVPIDSPSAEL